LLLQKQGLIGQYIHVSIATGGVPNMLICWQEVALGNCHILSGTSPVRTTWDCPD